MIADSVSERPILSVVICVVSDARHLEGCLAALSRQVNFPAIEIIVPHDGRENGISSLKPRFPGVQFYCVDHLRSAVSLQGSSREHHDELRAIGLGLARGEVVALLEDHGRVDKYWSMNVMESHKEPHAAIGGAIENEVDRPLNWAVYFCDFGRYQNPLKAGPSPFISDANSSYKRKALDSIRYVWKKAFHETSVNDALIDRGETLWLSPSIVVYQHRENLRLTALLRERYIWGRSYAGTRAQQIGLNKRLIYLALCPIIALVLMLRKTRDVLRKKRLVGVFLKAFPLTLLLTLFWSLGEFMGYLTACPSPYKEQDKDESQDMFNPQGDERKKNEYHR